MSTPNKINVRHISNFILCFNETLNETLNGTFNKLWTQDMLF